MPKLPHFARMGAFFGASDPVVYAEGRFTTRTYLSESFTISGVRSRDYGQPARYVAKVFDTDGWTDPPTDAEEYLVTTSPGGRVQLKLLVAREAGRVKELWVERVKIRVDGSSTLVEVLNLKRDDANRLIELLKNLESLPIEGDTTVRIDDSLLREVLADPDAVQTMYDRNREEFRSLIVEDESATDLIAIGHRRGKHSVIP